MYVVSARANDAGYGEKYHGSISNAPIWIRPKLRTRDTSAWFCVMLPPVRSFSISSSREYGPVCCGFDALATAAASWMSTRSRSESSGFGVPFVISSGAKTEIEWSLPPPFSFPPTREGRDGFPCAFPMEALNSGVSEFLRLMVDVRGRFWPAVVLGTGAAFGAGLDFCVFLGGASGAGHSTSWERSRRETGTHSIFLSAKLISVLDGIFTIKTFVKFFVVDTVEWSKGAPTRIKVKALLVIWLPFSTLNRQDLCFSFLAVLVGISLRLSRLSPMMYYFDRVCDRMQNLFHMNNNNFWIACVKKIQKLKFKIEIEICSNYETPKQEKMKSNHI